MSTLVYCTKCGTNNKDDTNFCINCGATLKGGAKPAEDFGRRMEEWGEDFGHRMERWGDDFGRRVEEDCFWMPYGGALLGIIFGVFIILMGIGVYFGYQVWRWIGPFALILFGTLILVAVLGFSRKRR